MSVYQFATESVTDYVVRLEKAFALLRDNYPEQLTMVDKTQHLRERFYRGLRLEIHQRLTPSYETEGTKYVTLLKRARQLEEEYSPKVNARARGARDDPQMQNVMQTLKEIKEQIQQHEDPTAHTLRRDGRGGMAATIVESRDTGGRPAHRSHRGKGKLQRWEVGVQLPSPWKKRSLLLLRVDLPLLQLARMVEGN